MFASKQELIRNELQEGTGAGISIAVDESGLRSGLRIWFSDLDAGHGPIAELRPHGLKGHRVTLAFGSFSGPVLHQIGKASSEDLQLARALIASIDGKVKLEVAGQDHDEWVIKDGGFHLTALVRDLENPFADGSVVDTCREVIVPVMAAMAELIGYDVIEEEIQSDEEPAYEGAVSGAVVTRRERNPRNRLLCIRVHGERCVVCGLAPRKFYGEAGGIIEVHHLEPLAALAAPRPYDPRVDLVPLCPNCHRAVHTRRPNPFSIEELRGMTHHASV